MGLYVFFFSLPLLSAGYFETGFWFSLFGLIVTPIILVMLIWWEPIAIMLGIVMELLDFKFKRVLKGGKEYAEGWMKIILSIILWALIVSYIFSVVPYWNDLMRVPFTILCVLNNDMIGYRWGGMKWYRGLFVIL